MDKRFQWIIDCNVYDESCISGSILACQGKNQEIKPIYQGTRCIFHISVKRSPNITSKSVCLWFSTQNIERNIVTKYIKTTCCILNKIIIYQMFLMVLETKNIGYQIKRTYQWTNAPINTIIMYLPVNEHKDMS